MNERLYRAAPVRFARPLIDSLERRMLLSAANPAALDADAAMNFTFRPPDAPEVPGYYRDDGGLIDGRNGLRFGWTKDHSDSAIQRGDGDRLLDTHVAVKAGSRWELEVPDGAYHVKIGVGDATAASQNNIWVEGNWLYRYVVQEADVFGDRGITVQVDDGTLTLGIGAAADFQTRLSYVEVKRIASAEPPPVVSPPAVPPPGNPTEPLRIMPLGDSITAGTNGAYRAPLYRKLSDLYPGRSIDFVGTATHAGSPTLPDRQHEGHGGYRIADISRNLDGNNRRAGNNGGYWLTGTATRKPITPNVILLHIGTNDIPYISASDMVEQLDALIDKLTTLRPQARLLLADLIVRNDFGEAKSRDYSARIPEIVAKYAAKGRHVTFVNMHDSVSPSDLYDGLHPNSAGEQKVAAVWSEAIHKAVR